MKYELTNMDCISIKEMPKNERPREKLKNLGVESLSDIELLCAIIGSGTRQAPVQDIAKKILQKITQTNGTVCVEEIAQIEGLGTAKASSICASIELGRRLHPIRKKKISSPEDIFNEIRHFGDRPQEHFICIMFNGALELLGVRVITVGLVNRTVVHSREVFREAIEMNSTAVVIAHNHPSGNLEPSEEDIEVTEKIRGAGKLLGIQLLDHLIFSSENYVSLREKNILWF